MDWANITKMHTPPPAKPFSPQQACAVQRQFRDRRAIERHC